MFTHPLHVQPVPLPEAQWARLHPQRVPGVVSQAARDGGLVIEDDKRCRGLPADSLEFLRLGLQLPHGNADGCMREGRGWHVSHYGCVCHERITGEIWTGTLGSAM